jgi:hypothetical protein
MILYKSNTSLKSLYRHQFVVLFNKTLNLELDCTYELIIIFKYNIISFNLIIICGIVLKFEKNPETSVSIFQI